MKAKNNTRINYAISIIAIALFAAGCAGPTITSTTHLPERKNGFYHRVLKGQTLWRISKIYFIDMDELKKVNNISETTKIETGQMLFIPYLKKEPVAFKTSSEDFAWPLKGKIIADFEEVTNNMTNKGINIKAVGNSNVSAARSGKVVFYSDNFYGFGKTIIIDHGDTFSSVYTRNSEVFVKTGDLVTKGMVIAKAGHAGRDKSDYLHFEVRKNNLPQNPHFYLP